MFAQKGGARMKARKNTSRKIRQTLARALSVALAFCLMSLGTVSAFAQTETGQLTTKIVDQNGAVIAGATVTIKSASKGLTRTLNTSPEGTVTFTNLQPGVYDITVTAKGFSPVTERADVTVGGKSEVTINASTQGAHETVNVVASQGGVEVNTQTQELSNVISAKQLAELPTLTRNPYDFVALSGNIGSDATGATNRGSGYSINGQRASSTGILLDGGENVDYFTANIGQSVPLDSIEEFRVITSNFTSEYGRASGGVVNLTTKSGTNNFHGTIFEFNRVSALAANDFFNNANSISKPVFTRNQFGYSFGGPILKDKLFFFSSTEWTRVRSVLNTIYVVPTPELIASAAPATQQFMSAFGHLKTAINGPVYTVNDIITSLGGKATFPAGPFLSLPGGMPAFGQAIVPLPADGGAGNPQNTVNSVNRVDFNMTDKTQIYGRYAITSLNYFPGFIDNSPYVGYDTPQTNLDQNILASVTHTFGDKLISQSKIVYNRLTQRDPLGSGPVGPSLFLLNAAPSSLEGQAVAFPGYNELNPAAGIPFGGPQNLLQAYEDVSYVRGKHQFRVGGQFVYIQDNRVFGAYEEAVEILGSNAGSGINHFLNGNLTTFQAAVNPQGKFPGQALQLPVGQPQFTRSNRYKDFALYVNDTYHIAPRVTLNLGLRYEYYGTQHNSNPNLDSNFYFGSGANFFEQIRNGSVQIAKNSPVGALWKASPHNFAPRLGFAWDVFGNGKTSLRGGYGIAYERNFGNVTFNVIQNPPGYAVVSLTTQDVASLPITLSNSGPLGGSSGTKVLPGTSLRAVNPNISTAYAHTYSAAVEHQITRNTVATIEYSGSTGVSLYDISNINRGGTGLVYLGSTATNPFTGAASGRLNGQYTNINFRSDNGKSRYNAVIFGLDSSALGKTGLLFTTKYRYSVSRDNLSSTFSDGGSGNFGNFILGYVDPFNPNLDYGYSDFDVRHRFSASAVWNIPFAKETKGVAKQALDGWQLNTIFTAASGTPFTVVDCAHQITTCTRLVPGPGASFSYSSSGSVGQDSSIPDQFKYIDLSHVNAVHFANPVSGNSEVGPFPSNMTGRNAFRGPGAWYLDLAVYKNFRVSEGKSIQFRTEAYDVFNHANMFISGPQLDISNGLGYAAAYKGTLVPLPLGLPPSHRNLQFALKFVF
jgi:hypothetical protein